MSFLYPDGYGTRMVTLNEMIDRHGHRMHPEFARRFFAYMEHKRGTLGVGGGFRTTQPDKPGFAPAGKSFHQNQQFRSGFEGYCAVDLVTTDGPDANNVHDGITWAMTADAPEWGLHTFITGEPWHIQPIEIRGWTSWKDVGSPDPDPFFLLPGQIPPPEPPGVPMPKRVIKKKGQAGAFIETTNKVWLSTAEERDAATADLGPIVELDHEEFRDAGPIVGRVPPGYNVWGDKK